MLAQFERKVIYLSDNAKQMQTKLTENMVEIKKILKIKINFDLWAVTYVTIINFPQRQVLTYNEAVHTHYLNFKIN